MVGTMQLLYKELLLIFVVVVVAEMGESNNLSEK